MLKEQKTNNEQRQPILVPISWVLWPVIILIGASIVMAFAFSQAPKPDKKALLPQPPLVKTQLIEEQNVTFKITSQGTVSSKIEADIVAEISGKIQWQSQQLVVGGYIKKGQDLIRLESDQYQINYQQASAQLENTQAKLLEEQARVEQAKETWKLTGNPLSKAPVLALRTPQLQQAKANVKSAEAQVRQAQYQLEKTTIRAPYDLLVLNKTADIGQFVSPGLAILKVAATSTVQVRLPIKSSDSSFINWPTFGQNLLEPDTVELFNDKTLPGYRWFGSNIRSEGQIQSKNRTRYLVAEIHDPYNVSLPFNHTDRPELPLGSFLNAQIKGKTYSELFKVPNNAVHGANKLYLLDKNQRLAIAEVKMMRSDQTFSYFMAGQIKEEFQVSPGQIEVIMTPISAPVAGMALRRDVDELITVFKHE